MCNELNEEDDEDYEKPSYYYTFENIEDIKELCPELYSEFQRMLNVKAKEAEEWKKKMDVILKFLDTPKIRIQIINQVEKKFYPR